VHVAVQITHDNDSLSRSSSLTQVSVTESHDRTSLLPAHTACDWPCIAVVETVVPFVGVGHVGIGRGFVRWGGGLGGVWGSSA